MAAKFKALDPVLVVDDEALIAYDIAAELADNGRAVIGPALSIAEAHAILDDHWPRSAILDIDVAGAPIWPIARRLRQYGCLIVFFSANCRHRELSDEFRNCRKIEKPADPVKIVELLEQLDRQAEFKGMLSDRS